MPIKIKFPHSKVKVYLVVYIVQLSLKFLSPKVSWSCRSVIGLASHSHTYIFANSLKKKIHSIYKIGQHAVSLSSFTFYSLKRITE